ncbi:MAG: hypothetical protein FWH32_08335 [Clostridiales bacterium]|nr:hypothetical protein [Clostridiales bacterium]
MAISACGGAPPAEPPAPTPAPPSAPPAPPHIDEPEDPPPDFSHLTFVSTDTQFQDDWALVRDARGYMQMVEDGFDSELAAGLMADIADILEQRNIPFVYVLPPPRFDMDDLPMSQDIDFFGQRHESFVDALKQTDIDVLDVQKELEAAGEPHLYPFKTDLHLETAGEFRTAMLLADKLGSLGVEIKDRNIAFNEGSYIVEPYAFRGWIPRWSDDPRPIEDDVFEIWLPEFDTRLTLENPSDDIVKQGTFQETVMNGKEKDESLTQDPNTNWVTNYMQWPSPYYTIENHMNEGGARLLVLLDSYLMRAVAYFSLGVGHITIIDPREEGGVGHLNDAIFSGDYDAVVIAAGVRDFFHSFALEHH